MISPTTTALVATIAVPVMMSAAIRWRSALIGILPFLVLLNGVPLPVLGVSVHFDQVIACLLTAAVGADVVAGVRRLRTDPVTWWLAGLLVVNLAASALNSPAPSYSLLECANLASVWVIYLLVINLVETGPQLESFFRRSLWAAAAEGCVSIAAYVLNVIGVPVGGADVSESAAERLTTPYGAYGTMVEPNIFGSFSAAYLVLCVVLLMIAAQRPSAVPNARLLRWVAVITAGGLVLSFTRAAWLGAAVGIAGFALFARPMLGVRVRVSRALIPLGLALGAIIVLWFLPGNAGDLFRFKVLNLFNIASPTGVIRLLTYVAALEQSRQHLLIGWGTFSFAPLALQGSDFRQFDNWQNLWIGNYFLLALHDTGIIGLTLWVGLISTILVRGVRAVRWLRGVNQVASSRAVALVCAVTTLLIPFLATSGFSLGYSWLLIGLLGAYCRPWESVVAPPLSDSPDAST